MYILIIISQLKYLRFYECIIHFASFFYDIKGVFKLMVPTLQADRTKLDKHISCPSHGQYANCKALEGAWTTAIKNCSLQLSLFVLCLIDGMDEYNNLEKAQMSYMYRAANDNARKAKRSYQECFVQYSHARFRALPIRCTVSSISTRTNGNLAKFSKNVTHQNFCLQLLRFVSGSTRETQRLS